MVGQSNKRTGESGHTPQMLRSIDDGPIAWTNDTLPPDAGFTPIPSDCRDELLRIGEFLQANPLPTLALKADDFDMPASRALMKNVHTTLEDGVGFVVIDRLPIDELDRETALGLYWLLGNIFGKPAAQKWDGTMMYDVRDTGVKPSPGNGVRSSISNMGQEYHTDNSYNLPPDYVGLFCLQNAMEGGINGVASFQAAHNKMLERHPDLLPRLYEPFCFDRQAEHAQGEPEINRFPVFSYDGKNIQTRYANSLVFGGHKIAGDPLDDVGRDAINALNAIMEEPEMRREFVFEPGQIQILDNRRLGHRRSAFKDSPDPERRRHLVRMWFRDAGRTFYNG